AQYRKGKKRLYERKLLPVKENLRLSERPPKGLSEKLPDEENLGPVKENPGFEKFEEGSLDNK
ncbi:2596_t:CDS:1, partial [Rhizophagus irregularis]